MLARPGLDPPPAHSGELLPSGQSLQIGRVCVCVCVCALCDILLRMQSKYNNHSLMCTPFDICSTAGFLLHHTVGLFTLLRHVKVHRGRE
jgi:hypothetical protein